MCARAKCIVSLASFFTWLSFFAAAVALFAPFWYTTEASDGLKRSKGLVLECREPFEDKNRSCDATLSDSWNKAKDGDYGDHFLIVQILWFAGCGCFLLSGVFTLALCCERCMNRCCSLFVTAFVFLAVGCLCAACVLFYLDNKNDFDRDEEEGYYDWGFYVAMGSAGTGLLALFFTILTICCIRKEVD